MSKNIIHRYVRIGVYTSPGTCSSHSISSMSANEAAVSTTVAAPITIKAALMLLRMPSRSPPPNFSENTVPPPMLSPGSIDVMNTISVYAEPTAARASGHTKRPTISVSAM